MQRTTTWIQTFSGKEFHYTLDQDQLISQICLEDICHSLAAQCRFLGHTSRPIPIHTHSLAVAFACPFKYELEALLHDAAEAYTGDIPTPLKQFLGVEFQLLQKAIETAIRTKYKLPLELSPAVRAADEAILFFEKNNFFDNSLDWGWEVPYPKMTSIKECYLRLLPPLFQAED